MRQVALPLACLAIHPDSNEIFFPEISTPTLWDLDMKQSLLGINWAGGSERVGMVEGAGGARRAFHPSWVTRALLPPDQKKQKTPVSTTRHPGQKRRNRSPRLTIEFD